MDANQTKRIAEIRQMEEAEPSGPRWTHSKYLHCVLGSDGFGVATLSQNRTGKTIEFISHSRSDIPYLLDLIQEQAAEIERLEERLETQKQIIGGYVESERKANAEIERLMAAILEYWRHGNTENLQEIGVEIAIASQETKEMETKDKEKIK